MISQSNALAEIALALAMAFFSIMVLTLVSMGAGRSAAVDTSRVNVPPAVQMTESASGTDAAAQTALVRPADLIIYYGGRFLSADLAEMSPAKLTEERFSVLAVDPALSAGEVVKIRRRFSTSISVTVLTDDWLRVLQEGKK